jgi:hypothetical protein
LAPEAIKKKRKWRSIPAAKETKKTRFLAAAVVMRMMMMMRKLSAVTCTNGQGEREAGVTVARAAAK